MQSKNKTVLVFVLGLIFGLGTMALVQPQIALPGGNVYQQLARFAEVLTDISRLYVEDVDEEKLVTEAINGMLEALDPHSVYIPEKQLRDVNERFEGHFEGIGIEFVIQNKYPTVVSPIPDSPSDRLGLRPGDKIIEIEGVSTYGITEDEVMKKLRGPRGTTVNITVERLGVDEPLHFAITRDRISIYSILASFMIDQQTGYIKLNRFSRTTEDELIKALEKLKRKGMKRLILDLRFNSGGFLDQAVAVANKFIPAGKKIVYTRGRIQQANEDFYATEDPYKIDIPLVILINHGSASASEIVAGAVQDWDRGLIVGERSFGKGLVQNQVPLKDGSAIRITIARYYTPSGRLIQRPYNNGRKEYYEEAWQDPDTLALPDSTHPRFYTAGGRVVYGGGGIYPDVVVRSEKITGFSVNLIRKRLFFEFASLYAARHPELRKDPETFIKTFETTPALLESFKSFIRSKEVEFSAEAWKKDLAFIKTRIKSEIARSLWNSEKYYEVEVREDKQVLAALKNFKRAAELAALHYKKEPFNPVRND